MNTDLAPLHRVLPDGLPELLREMAEQLYLELLEGDALPLPPDVLADAAMRQMLRLSEEFGGTYLVKGVSFRLSPRNRAMCQEFKGDYKALARKHKLSEQQCRNIVDAWQRERFLQRQHDMFQAGQPAQPETRR